MDSRHRIYLPSDFRTPADLQQVLDTGAAVVVSQRGSSGHAPILGWAKRQGLFTPVDRGSDWGNPFVLGPDGDRAQVITAHARRHLPRRRDLLDRLAGGELAGRVLGCWCAPKPCHGHVLAALTSDPDMSIDQALALVLALEIESQARPHRDA